MILFSGNFYCKTDFNYNHIMSTKNKTVITNTLQISSYFQAENPNLTFLLLLTKNDLKSSLHEQHKTISSLSASELGK